MRDIVSWIGRRDNLYISEPLVIDGKTIRGEKQRAVWDVLLSCDHFGHQTAEPDWDPKEGPGAVRLLLHMCAHPVNRRLPTDRLAGAEAQAGQAEAAAPQGPGAPAEEARS